jgi:hypothetical protein
VSGEVEDFSISFTQLKMNQTQPVVIVNGVETLEDPGTTLGHIMVSAPTCYEIRFEVIRSPSYVLKNQVYTLHILENPRFGKHSILQCWCKISPFFPIYRASLFNRYQIQSRWTTIQHSISTISTVPISSFEQLPVLWNSSTIKKLELNLNFLLLTSAFQKSGALSFNHIVSMFLLSKLVQPMRRVSIMHLTELFTRTTTVKCS